VEGRSRPAPVDDAAHVDISLLAVAELDDSVAHRGSHHYSVVGSLSDVVADGEFESA
jgi:hypothetical protein